MASKRPEWTQCAENENVPSVDDSESKRLFMEAMKHGYVDTLLNVLLLIGAAGSGKTHAKHLFLGLPPPLIRESTPLAEEAVRTISTLQATVSDANEMIWELVTLQKLKLMLAGAIKFGPSFFKVLQSQLPLPTTSRSEPDAGSHGTPPQPDSTEAASNAHSRVTDESPGNTLAASVHTPVGYELDQELLDLIKLSEGSQKLFDVDWVYIIDSGGQPSFREILPLFVCTATAVAFFLKLNERLSDKPTIEYYGSDGQRCGASYSSLLTNEQILLHCVRSMQSRHSLSSDASAPSVFVVGTHKDREHECKETRAEKNAKLLEVLEPCFGKKLAYYSVKQPEEVIFPVNAKTPATEDQKVAKAFRNKVGRMGGRVKLPLPWFVLEQYVDKLALELKRKVLRMQECEQEAKKLEMDQRACEAALEFLDKLDRLFYRPNVLKGLVFCGAQVPLDKISELIKLLHMVIGLVSSHGKQSPSEAVETRVQMPGSSTDSGPDPTPVTFPELSEFDDEQLLDLRKYGIITIEVLKKFPKHYVDGLFSPEDFLKLLTAFQVAAPLSEGSAEYVMPCLLQELASQGLDQHRQLDPSSSVAPLLIQFPDNWVPAGVFTVLIAYLQNIAHWKVCLLSSNPRCFYRNCVEFRLPTGHGGSVTLVDSFQYIEVHVLKAKVKTCLKACSRIVHDVLEGIKQAALRLHYGTLEPKMAFFCQTPTPDCKSTAHLAHLAEDEWVCSVNPDINGELSSQHQVWMDQLTNSAFGQKSYTSSSHKVPQSMDHIDPGRSAGELHTPPTDSHIPSTCTAGDTASGGSADGFSDTATAAIHASNRPTMMELVCFRGRRERINLPQEIGVRYRQFGILLLEDSTGARVEGIIHHLRDPEQINMKILQQWLEGRGLQPVTWETLIGVLQSINLDKLAKDIADIKQ